MAGTRSRSSSYLFAAGRLGSWPRMAPHGRPWKWNASDLALAPLAATKGQHKTDGAHNCQNPDEGQTCGHDHDAECDASTVRSRGRKDVLGGKCRTALDMADEPAHHA